MVLRSWIFLHFCGIVFLFRSVVLQSPGFVLQSIFHAVNPLLAEHFTRADEILDPAHAEAELPVDLPITFFASTAEGVGDGGGPAAGPSSYKVPASCPAWGGPGFQCFIEWDEWMMVWALLDDASWNSSGPRRTSPRTAPVVLEFGARYATTSCVLAHFAGKDGSVVSVDPDPLARKFAIANMRAHRCRAHHVQGTVTGRFGGGFRYFSGLGGYDGGTKEEFPERPEDESAVQTNTVVEVGGGQPRGVFVPNFHFSEVEVKIGKKFNTLLIDCEGCITQLFEAEQSGLVSGSGLPDSGRETDTETSGRKSFRPNRPSLLDGIDLVLMEEDKEHEVSSSDGYTGYHGFFRRKGFVRVWHSHDTYRPGLSEWSRIMRHSAWLRPAGALGSEILQRLAERVGGTFDHLASSIERTNAICHAFWRAQGFRGHSELFCVDEGSPARNPDFPTVLEGKTELMRTRFNHSSAGG